MPDTKFERLVSRGLLTREELGEIIKESGDSGKYPEELLIGRGIPRHEVLFCLSEFYGYPFVEYDEEVMASYLLTRRLDMEKLKQALWFPLSVMQDRAEVIAYKPDDTAVVEDIKKSLGVEKIDFIVALPSDLVRIIENNNDVNPGFPFSGGRTPLAKVRTFLADRRSLMSCYRTSMAKGRTGLAFLRTGIAFIAIALLLLRIFAAGHLIIIEALFFVAGVVLVVNGFRWYVPTRKAGKKRLNCAATMPTWGTTLLEVQNPGNNPFFTRTNTIDGADKLRADWDNLTPVMRRRFLASDRTDFAEERTALACYRTMMARARTGLAFTRTGIALIGLGIALFRQFPIGSWTLFDAALILTGLMMAMEGFYWYFPGRRAGVEGFESVMRKKKGRKAWDFISLPVHRVIGGPGDFYKRFFQAKASYSPGIWATTGLALERTVLADRRNMMARLRTVMARSRTGMAFIRTGRSICAVGMGLLVYFGTADIAWAIFNIALIVIGLVVIADGLYWNIPAERIRKQFPYCVGDMEIIVPDYGRPARYWEKVGFNHDAR